MQTQSIWPLQRWLIAANISHKDPEKKRTVVPRLKHWMAGHGHTTINYHSVKRNAGSPASYLLKKGGTESLVQRPRSFLHWQPCGWGYRKTGALWLLHEYTPIEKLCSVNRWNPRKNGAGQVFLTANSGLIAPSVLWSPIVALTVSALTSLYTML